MHHFVKFIGFSLLYILIMLSTLLPGPARSEWYVSDNGGGEITEFLARLNTIRTSGEQVRVEGKCYSACTAVLALDAQRLCFEPGAVLGFHTAWWRSQAGGKMLAVWGTTALWNLYPPPVQEMIRHRGNLSQKMVYIKAEELWSIYAPCAGHRSSTAREAFAWTKDKGRRHTTAKKSFNAHDLY